MGNKLLELAAVGFIVVAAIALSLPRLDGIRERSKRLPRDAVGTTPASAASAALGKAGSSPPWDAPYDSSKLHGGLRARVERAHAAALDDALDRVLVGVERDRLQLLERPEEREA